MLGIPQDEREPLRDWSLAILGALEPVLSRQQFDTGVAAVAEFKDYLDAIIVHRAAQRPTAIRRKSSRRSSPPAILLRRRQKDEQLSKLELIHNCIFLLNAGHETTTNLIGNARRSSDPPSRRDARPAHAIRSIIETAVEEFLRMESSNQLGNRRAVQIRRLAASLCRRHLRAYLHWRRQSRSRRNFPIPTVSISGASRTGISPSAPAFMPAPECRLRAWKRRSAIEPVVAALRADRAGGRFCPQAAAPAFAASRRYPVRVSTAGRHRPRAQLAPVGDSAASCARSWLCTTSTKPNNANAAQNSQIARSNALAVSTIAARPRSFTIARVLPPLAAASRAKRDMSCGSSATARPSSAACVPALLSTRPAFSGKFDQAAGVLDLHRFARRAHGQHRIRAARCGAPP